MLNRQTPIWRTFICIHLVQKSKAGRFLARTVSYDMGGVSHRALPGPVFGVCPYFASLTHKDYSCFSSWESCGHLIVLVYLYRGQTGLFVVPEDDLTPGFVLQLSIWNISPVFFYFGKFHCISRFKVKKRWWIKVSQIPRPPSSEKNMISCYWNKGKAELPKQKTL